VSCGSAGSCAAGGGTPTATVTSVARGQRGQRRAGLGDPDARPDGPERGRVRRRRLAIMPSPGNHAAGGPAPAAPVTGQGFVVTQAG